VRIEVYLPQQDEASVCLAGAQQPVPQAQSLHVQLPSLQQSLPQQAVAARFRKMFLSRFMGFSLLGLL
jgi:hypothetical protein